jgi:hypothetical protein
LLYEDAAEVGLLVFAAVAALCVPGVGGVASLARLLRSLYASLLLGAPREALQAIAGLLLHAGLAVLAASHIGLLYSLLAGSPMLVELVAVVRVAAWMVAAGAAASLVSRILRGRGVLGSSLCCIIVDALLVAASLAALARPWTWLHWVPGAAAAALASYMLARGHVVRAARLRSERMLRV